MAVDGTPVAVDGAPVAVDGAVHGATMAGGTMLRAPVAADGAAEATPLLQRRATPLLQRRATPLLQGATPRRAAADRAR